MDGTQLETSLAPRHTSPSVLAPPCARTNSPHHNAKAAQHEVIKRKMKEIGTREKSESR